MTLKKCRLHSLRSGLSVALALALEWLPAARTAAVSAARTPAWAIVTRWVAGAFAVGESMHAVSGATGLTVANQSGTTVAGTNGLPMGFRVVVSSPQYGLAQSFSAVGLPSGLKINAGSSSSLGGQVSGVPAVSGTFKVSVTGWQHSPPNNTSDLNNGHFFTSTLTVIVRDVAPQIVSDPKNQTAVLGGSASFTVSASGTSLAYQWIAGDVEIPKATNATLTVSPVVAGSAGGYKVRVSNSGGSIVSQAATLTVTQPLTATLLPVLGTSPFPLHLGEVLRLSAQVSGATASGYQWWHDGQRIPAGTNAAFTLGPVDAAAGGSYSVVVSTSAGPAASDPVTILVGPALTLGTPRPAQGGWAANAATLAGRIYQTLTNTDALTGSGSPSAAWTATSAQTTVALPGSLTNLLVRVHAVDPQ